MTDRQEMVDRFAVAIVMGLIAHERQFYEAWGFRDKFVDKIYDLAEGLAAERERRMAGQRPWPSITPEGR